MAVAAVVLLVAGCGSTPPTVEPPAPPTPSEADRAVDAGRGEFTVAAGMNDTWNAVGQILIRLDGVTYEMRAQMLGIYTVRYRGERFIILTRALLANSERKGLATEVGALWLDGKPNNSPAALDLLKQLQRRLPDELALIAAGGRGKPKH
ncbi:hypothetical protein MNR01_14555 [Lysobacter sp. S4-A87]|uniref:hypothetical protein n=1 Tax=Lysobacter sp. S4-A87 TaxID=2925843 RepID=UPI001F53D399|nr:hypothetical protein [Lysobacter sp. S4-A87]UNK48945.1 hypothetical protein MNR01_14555 [Lysobacter sp. S4-A87]